MTRDNIIKKVKARIDELSPFSDEELNPAISLIDELLNDSTITILMILPLYLLEPETIDTTTLVSNDRIGKLVLPNDFIRLYSFKMVGWSTEVSEAISTHNPKYKLQKHKVTMGGTSKPVVVIKSTKTNKVLHYYSLPSGATHTVEEALYVKANLPENLTDNLTDFIAWQCASDVLLSMEMGDLSLKAKEKLFELINIKAI